MLHTCGTCATDACHVTLLGADDAGRGDDARGVDVWGFSEPHVPAEGVRDVPLMMGHVQFAWRGHTVVVGGGLSRVGGVLQLGQHAAATSRAA